MAWLRVAGERANWADTISSTGAVWKGRGEFAPTWELAAAVYGRNATYVQQVRMVPGYVPEGKPPPIIHGGAHCGDGPPGQGTLTFYGMPPPVWTGSGVATALTTTAV